MQKPEMKNDYLLWLLKAESDLKAAKKLSDDQDTADGSVYHAQQAAEKAFKAFLVSKKQSILRTHDLMRLLEMCSSFDSSFLKFVYQAAKLTPYSSKFRYPDDVIFPSDDEVLCAIEYAAKILSFVKGKLKQASSDQNLKLFDE